jgi:type VI secretion system secreted protein VgrG
VHWRVLTSTQLKYLSSGTWQSGIFYKTILFNKSTAPRHKSAQLDPLGQMTQRDSLQSTLLSSTLTQFTQGARLLRLTTPLGNDSLLVECVRGEEGLSEGFRFSIAALSLDSAIPLRSLIGQPILLELLTAHSRTDLRPFHGHVTAIDMAGANGGFARYNLVLEPWTAFLGLGRDSRIFQDMTVFDIIDAVFAASHGSGKLVPAWRFDLLDRERYPVRSITTQYQESDLAFIERLMHEEGLFYFFEHLGDAARPGLGSHTMVIADHNGSFKPNVQPQIAFSQPGATMHQDTLDRWRTEYRLQTNAIELNSWDYRSLDTRPVSAHSQQTGNGMQLVSRDTPGAYAYSSRAQGQRIADLQLEALEARKEIHVGAGTVRTCAPGTTFMLTGHHALDQGADDDARTFLMTRAVHLMHNNLSADMTADLMQHLGRGALDAAIQRETGDSLHTVGKQAGERPLYRVRIDAIRSKTPYRSSGVDQHGQLLHPRPTVHGQQTAIVVGPAGTAVHTDRDHRIKVQFHWQRGVASHSRLQHPTPDGHTGAPADDRAGTWVRVATPMAPVAGANWGSNALPRVGQEVLVDFLEGNIDRPVVLGTLYNGRGQDDNPHNQVSSGAGVATGNAPAWFPGKAGAHAHPAALSGMKTQAMGTSQAGSGAYNQLVFDDSPGQARVSLQRHANAHEGTAELNLGHLLHQSDNQRFQSAGFGAELKTEHSVALRSAKGLLLSTDARGSGAGGQMDASEPIDQVKQSMQLQTDLLEVAHKHNARLKKETTPTAVLPLQQMQHIIGALGATASGASAADTQANEVAAYTEPLIQLSSPSGIAAVSPVNVVLAAGQTSSLVADHGIDLAAQGNLYQSVIAGIGLFTYGKVGKPDTPNQETGIRLHAASGKISMQSQSDTTTITADKAVTVASVTKQVNVRANTHVVLTAQGASLRLEGGNISIWGPGTMAFKASMKELTGPASANAQGVLLPAAGKLSLCEMRAAGAASNGDSLVPVA